MAWFQRSDDAVLGRGQVGHPVGLDEADGIGKVASAAQGAVDDEEIAAAVAGLLGGGDLELGHAGLEGERQCFGAGRADGAQRVVAGPGADIDGVR
ncbi:MAG: hypothetical protein LC792_26840 [Actinobacteria bacterium]|nr:hypothetical protein [Actinomycetota bacterium]